MNQPSSKCYTLEPAKLNVSQGGKNFLVEDLIKISPTAAAWQNNDVPPL